jgi:hypothetical protein
MNMLLNGFTTLKRSPVFTRKSLAETGHQMLDNYTLGLGSDGRYCVHIERLEANGASSEAYLYLGTDLDAANWAYGRYAEGK